MEDKWFLMIGYETSDRQAVVIAVTMQELFSDSRWKIEAREMAMKISALKRGDGFKLTQTWQIFFCFEDRWREVRRLSALGISANCPVR